MDVFSKVKLDLQGDLLNLLTPLVMTPLLHEHLDSIADFLLVKNLQMHPYFEEC